MSINVNGFQIHSDQVQGEFKWFKVWPEIIYSAPDAASPGSVVSLSVSSNKNYPNLGLETRTTLSCHQSASLILPCKNVKTGPV